MLLNLNCFPQSPTHTVNSPKSKNDTYCQTQGTFLSKDEDLEMYPEVQQKILDNIQNK